MPAVGQNYCGGGFVVCAKVGYSRFKTLWEREDLTTESDRMFLDSIPSPLHNPDIFILLFFYSVSFLNGTFSRSTAVGFG